MKRHDAIEQLALMQLAELTEEEREEQLFCMSVEAWDGHEDWKSLPKEIRAEYEDGEWADDPNSKKYDAVLMIWLKDTLKAVTNDFLLRSLNADSIEGEPLQLIA